MQRWKFAHKTLTRHIPTVRVREERNGAGPAHVHADPQSFNALPLQINQFLKDLIRCGDDAGIRLEPTLRGDHFNEALAKIDIG